MQLSRERQRFFEEIAKWPIDARDESDPDYFIKFKGVSKIEDGDICFVIGRKGSGKTAIAEYINNKSSTENRSKILSFSNFPFNILYGQKDRRFKSNSSYITVWKFVIYSAICTLMKDDPDVDGKCRADLQSVFDLNFDVALGRSIETITGKTFGASLAGYGMNFGETRAQSTEISLDGKVQALEKLILDYCGENNYFIIFDSLDDDYSYIFEEDGEFQEYRDLLSSLFKSVLNVKDVFKKYAKNIKPVVLLRDDIFSLLNSNDKNKWNDRLITLNWNKESLRSLIVGRLSTAVTASGSHWISADDESDIILNIFQKDTYKYIIRKKQRSVDIIDYMIRSTLLRPRDIIIFMRELIRYMIRCNAQSAFIKEIKEAEHSYSNYLKEELENEIHPIIPNIGKVFDAIAKIRKEIFSRSEFEEKLISVGYFENRKTVLNFITTVEILYKFGVLGNITKAGNYRIFSFDSNRKEVDADEYLCVHRGLIRSFHVADTPNLLAAEE